MRSQLRTCSLHETRIRPGVSAGIRGQALSRGAANGAPPDEFFRLALVCDRHRHLWGALQFHRDGHWGHARCAIDGADDGNDRRSRDGLLAARLRAFALAVAGTVCRDSLLLPVVVGRTGRDDLIYGAMPRYLAYTPRTLRAAHGIGGGRGRRLHYLPHRNRRGAGRRCHRHRARATAVRGRHFT